MAVSYLVRTSTCRFQNKQLRQGTRPAPAEALPSRFWVARIMQSQRSLLLVRPAVMAASDKWSQAALSVGAATKMVIKV